MLFVSNRGNDSLTKNSYFQRNERLTGCENRGRTSKYRMMGIVICVSSCTLLVMMDAKEHLEVVIGRIDKSLKVRGRRNRWHERLALLD